MIEVDGLIHQQQGEEDQLRDEYLGLLGMHVIRFTNEQVLNDLDRVIEKILNFFESVDHTS